MTNKFKTPDPKKARRYFSRKLAFTTAPAELSAWLKQRKDIKVFDVRDAKSFAKGHIPGALHLPEERWRRAADLDKKKTYVVCGESRASNLAARAALELASVGLPVMELDGGLEAWKQIGKPIQKGVPRKPAPRKPAPTAEIAAATQSEEAPTEAVSVAEAN